MQRLEVKVIQTSSWAQDCVIIKTFKRIGISGRFYYQKPMEIFKQEITVIDHIKVLFHDSLVFFLTNLWKMQLLIRNSGFYTWGIIPDLYWPSIYCVNPRWLWRHLQWPIISQGGSILPFITPRHAPIVSCYDYLIVIYSHCTQHPIFLQIVVRLPLLIKDFYKCVFFFFFVEHRLHTYECDTTASLIAPRRDEAQIGRACRRNLLLLSSLRCWRP